MSFYVSFYGHASNTLTSFITMTIIKVDCVGVGRCAPSACCPFIYLFIAPAHAHNSNPCSSVKSSEGTRSVPALPGVEKYVLTLTSKLGLLQLLMPAVTTSHHIDVCCWACSALRFGTQGPGFEPGLFHKACCKPLHSCLMKLRVFFCLLLSTPAFPPGRYQQWHAAPSPLANSSQHATAATPDTAASWCTARA